MNTDFYHRISALQLAVVFFILIFLFLWIGHRYRTAQLAKGQKEEAFNLGSAESFLLTLTALLLSFTFGAASSKYESRRQVIVEEANDIGTAILRCDLYSDSTREKLRIDFKDYLETRINYYDAGDDPIKVAKELEESNVKAKKIWDRVTAMARDRSNVFITAQMIPALNNVIDIVATREANRQAIVPRFIVWVLCILVLTTAFLIGYSSKGKKRQIIVAFAFALITTLTLFLILELDRAQQGLINLDAAAGKLVELRSLFVIK